MDTRATAARRRLREEMKRKKLTQRDLAGMLDWSQSRVAKILTGRVGLLVDDLESLCFALGLTLTEAIRDHGLEFAAEMTPTELRILETMRELPPPVRDHFWGLLLFQSKARVEHRGVTKSRQLIHKGRVR